MEQIVVSKVIVLFRFRFKDIFIGPYVGINDFFKFLKNRSDGLCIYERYGLIGQLMLISLSFSYILNVHGLNYKQCIVVSIKYN
jgi:hypothetical protein